MKQDLKRAIAAIPLFIFSNMVMATEAVSLSSADLDRVTAGSQTELKGATEIFSRFYADLNKLRPVDFFPFQGQAISTTQLNADQMALWQRLSSIKSMLADQLKLGEPVSLNQFSSSGLVPSDHNNSSNIVITAPSASGQSIWIQQSTSGGGYAYIFRNGTVTSLKIN